MTKGRIEIPAEAVEALKARLAEADGGVLNLATDPRPSASLHVLSRELVEAAYPHLLAVPEKRIEDLEGQLLAAEAERKELTRQRDLAVAHERLSQERNDSLEALLGKVHGELERLGGVVERFANEELGAAGDEDCLECGGPLGERHHPSCPYSPASGGAYTVVGIQHTNYDVRDVHPLVDAARATHEMLVDGLGEPNLAKRLGIALEPFATQPEEEQR